MIKTKYMGIVLINKSVYFCTFIWMQIPNPYTYSFPNMTNNLNSCTDFIIIHFPIFTSTAIHFSEPLMCKFEHGLLVLNTSVYTPWEQDIHLYNLNIIKIKKFNTDNILLLIHTLYSDFP